MNFNLCCVNIYSKLNSKPTEIPFDGNSFGKITVSDPSMRLRTGTILKFMIWMFQIELPSCKIHYKFFSSSLQCFENVFFLCCFLKITWKFHRWNKRVAEEDIPIVYAGVLFAVVHRNFFNFHSVLRASVSPPPSIFHAYWMNITQKPVAIYRWIINNKYLFVLTTDAYA